MSIKPILRLLDLDNGEEKDRIITVNDALQSTTMNDVYLLCMDKDYKVTEQHIMLALKNKLEGFKLFELLMSKLPEMPLNWYKRCKELPKNLEWLPKDCPGILSPTTLIRIVTTWEIYENKDGTRQYILKENLLDGINNFTSSLIQNIQVEIPVDTSVEYHNMQLVVTNFKKEELCIQFEKCDNILKAVVNGVMWTNGICNKLHISISFTAPSSYKIGLMEVIYRFDNIVLNKYLSYYISRIKIERKKNMLNWSTGLFSDSDSETDIITPYYQ